MIGYTKSAQNGARARGRGCGDWALSSSKNYELDLAPLNWGPPLHRGSVSDSH